jgi:acyl carrier protein
MTPTLNEIIEMAISSVNDITRSWSLDVTTLPETKLVDELGFSSMEFIDLLATLETRLQQKLQYERLIMTDQGTYRQELTVKELCTFIHETFDQTRPAPGPV